MNDVREFNSDILLSQSNVHDNTETHSKTTITHKTTDYALQVTSHTVTVLKTKTGNVKLVYSIVSIEVE